MDPAVRDRVERLLRDEVVAARVAGAGFTPADRWVVALASGRTAFVKAATNQVIAGWLRAEQRLYSSVSAVFVPRLLAWDDDGAKPVLLLEDLSDAHWPPPWRPRDVDAVLAALDRLHALSPPAGFPPAGEVFASDGWARVAADPAPFLAVGVATAAWLEGVLPTLLAAESAFRIEGRSLLHLDVRSDNLCIRDGGALLVDWNHASVGNPLLDLAFWLPSLEMEGGPPPERLLRDAPEAAATVSGFFAARAGLPPVPGAPGVRPVQVAQLRTALPWAARALGIAPPGRTGTTLSHARGRRVQ